MSLNNYLGERSEAIKKTRILLFQKLMMSWYIANGRNFPWRRKSISNYQKIVVEVLLQRTRAEVVAAFFPSFVHKFPNWQILAKATETDLQMDLKPLGLWRRRALSLLELARAMAIRQGRFPRSRDEIERLPSVGQYIANAVLLFCFSEPQPLLDAGMARVLERVFGNRKRADIRYDPYLQDLARAVVDTTDSIIINWAILDLASLICRPHNPRCDWCPVNQICLYAKEISESDGKSDG